MSPARAAVASLRHVHKLVATDLDGTLLHTDGTVTARTRAALTRSRTSASRWCS